MAGRKVRRPDLTLAVPDHNLPTTARLEASGKRIPKGFFDTGFCDACGPSLI